MEMGTVLWNKTLLLHKVPCAKSVNRKISQMQSVCFASLPLNTGLAPRKINPCAQEKEAYKSHFYDKRYLGLTTLFTICIAFLTEENVWVSLVELPGWMELPQGNNWASAVFQKPAGSGRSGKRYLEPEALKMVVMSVDQAGRLQEILPTNFAATQ